MKDKVLQTIQKYNLIENADKIVVGVSGGPDSIVLLNILYELKNDKSLNLNFEICVAHINHMLRQEAIEDEEYVKKFAKEKQIDFYSKRIDVKKIANNSKIGTEEAGRKVRYQFFEEILKKTNSNKIAIAHNKNDSIETIFMHILRGSGLNGLKGIEPKRGNLIRPIIECEREEIEKYCDAKKLNPRIDKTNFENKYTRNKIRNVLIPYIKKEFNPNIIETVNRLSKLIIQEEQYIENEVKKIYKKIVISQKEKEIILDLKEFNKQEKVIKSRLILYTITRIFGSSQGIENIHIEDIIKLCSNNIGNKFLTPNKNIKILVKNHKIYFTSQT